MGRTLTKIESDLIKEIIANGFTVTEIILYAKDFLLREAEDGDDFAECQYSALKKALKKVYYGIDTR